MSAAYSGFGITSLFMAAIFTLYWLVAFNRHIEQRLEPRRANFILPIAASILLGVAVFFFRSA